MTTEPQVTLTLSLDDARAIVGAANVARGMFAAMPVHEVTKTLEAPMATLWRELEHAVGEARKGDA